MGEEGDDSLSDFANILTERAPNSIKEITKVLVEMTSKIVEVVSELKSEVKALNASNNSIKHELESFRASVKYINDSFEEFRNDIKSLRDEMSEAETRSLQCQRDNKKLDKELRETKKQLTELKQYSRRNNIELKGVPFNEGDDLNKKTEDDCFYLACGTC